MIPYSALHPTDLNPIPPDTVGSIIITTANAVVAQDWPTNAQIVTFSSTVPHYINWRSTSVTIPSTNQSGTTASSGLSEMNAGTITRQISTGTSTGYSITGATSGVVTLSAWRK